MATAPMTGAILPQYQGDYYTLQNQQAIAQALMQGSIQNQANQIPTNMPVMPKYNIGAGIAQLGQALLAGKLAKDTSEGYRNLGSAQMGYLLGQPTAGSTPSASAQPGAAVTPQTSGGLLSAGGPLNPNGMDPRAAMMMYLSGPEGQKELFKSTTAAYAPTAATLAARQGGMDPTQANRMQFMKDSYVAPFTGTGVARDPFTLAPRAFTPEAPENASPVFDATGNVVGFRAIQGGQEILQGNAAAKTAGEGSQLPAPVQYDASGNPLPTMSRTDAVNGNSAGAISPDARAIVATESNGNPNAVSPKGAVGAWQLMPNTKANPGFGVIPAANNSPAELNRVGKDYYEAMVQRYSSPTLGAIAYNMGPGATDAWLKNGARFEDLPAETRNYVGKVSTLTALNSGAGLPSNAGASPQPGKPVAYPVPPLAAQKNAEGIATGQIDTMQKSYQGLQGARSGGNAALQDIDNMIGLSQGKNVATAGTYLAKLAGLTSANAAEYEKSRDNLVSNLSGQLGMSTDSARDLVYGSIPSYGAPKQAIENGLNTLKGQVQMRMLKADYLSQAYAGGDAKTYNRLENQFDQNMTPKVSSVIAMPPGPQRAQALSIAAKDPQIRARLEWAAQNGILK